jgi:hypothetical protein
MDAIQLVAGRNANALIDVTAISEIYAMTGSVQRNLIRHPDRPTAGPRTAGNCGD